MAFATPQTVLAAPGEASKDTARTESVSVPTLSELYLSGQSAESSFDRCKGTEVQCLSYCKEALALYNQAFIKGRDSDLLPLRVGHALATRCKARERASADEVCRPGDPRPSDACGYLFDFDVEVRFTRPLHLLNPPARLPPQPWWDDVQKAEVARLNAKHELAADLFTAAYDRCQRLNFDGSDHCIPLVREVLHTRQLAYGTSQTRQRIEDSLQLVERELKADDRTCQRTNSKPLREVCTLHQDLLVLYGLDLLVNSQYRDAADSFERAYRSCTSRGESVPNCWASFGRPSWGARHHLLVPGKAQDSEQRGRAITFLTQFVLDMNTRCDDPTLPQTVADVCHDLKVLQSLPAQTEQPEATEETKTTFLAVAIPRDPTLSALKNCPSGAAVADCWPQLRASTVERIEAMHETNDPAAQAAITRAAQRDLETFVEQTGTDCKSISLAPGARACALARAHHAAIPAPVLATVGPPRQIDDKPKPPHEPPPPSPNRGLLIAGATSVSLAGLSFAAMVAGMVLGRQATEDLEKARGDDLIGGSWRDDPRFDRGVVANKIATVGSILGATLLSVGVVLLVVDARQRRPKRLSLRPGGLRVSF